MVSDLAAGEGHGVTTRKRVDNPNPNGYCVLVEAEMNKLKRVADFLEKLSVAGIALGIFQNNFSGMGWAILFFIVSLVLTKEQK